MLRLSTELTIGDKFCLPSGCYSIKGRASHSSIVKGVWRCYTHEALLSPPSQGWFNHPGVSVTLVMRVVLGFPHPWVPRDESPTSYAHSATPFLRQRFHPVGEKGVLRGGISEDKNV